MPQRCSIRAHSSRWDGSGAYVRQVFLYCLAVAARRYGVQVHAVTVMSNHYHIVATDARGTLPRFYWWLNEFVSRALNREHKREESMWNSKPTSRVHLLDSDAVLDKVVYTLANPVEAGLVSHGKRWPGVRLVGPHTQRIERPRFFREDGPMAPEVRLELTMPPVDARSAAKAARLIRNGVRRRERAIRDEFHANNRTFLGVDALAAQRITDTPASSAGRGDLCPTIATRDRWLRLEALQRCKRWLHDYLVALERWIGGEREAVFPAGTYLMAQQHGVRVAPG